MTGAATDASGAVCEPAKTDKTERSTSLDKFTRQGRPQRGPVPSSAKGTDHRNYAIAT